MEEAIVNITNYSPLSGAAAIRTVFFGGEGLKFLIEIDVDENEDAVVGVTLSGVADTNEQVPEILADLAAMLTAMAENEGLVESLNANAPEAVDEQLPDDFDDEEDAWPYYDGEDDE